MEYVSPSFNSNYSMLSYRDSYRGDLLQYNPDDSTGSDLSVDEDQQEFLELFRDNALFNKYENAISQLVNNDVLTAKQGLLDLVNSAVQPAYYAYALVLLKELVKQCDIHSGVKGNAHIMRGSEDDIEEAVQLLEMAKKMEPASSFLLGMMGRLDIGQCSQLIGGSWKDSLIHVVDTAVSLSFFNISKSALEDIDHKYTWVSWGCGLGMQKKQDYLKEMAKYSLYEITIDMSEKQFDCNTLNELFTILFQDGFPNASYSYAVMLIQKKIDGVSQGENMKKAIGHLEDAISAGYKEAGLLLGALLFKSSVSRMLRDDQKKYYVTKLEEYINKSDDSYPMNKRNVDKITLCLAEHYYKEESHLVKYDRKKAERMLCSRGLYKELVNLKEQFQIELPPSSSISSVSKIDFIPKHSSTSVKGHSSSSGVGEQGLSIRSEDENVFDPNKPSTFREEEERRRDKKSAVMKDSSDWPTF